MVPKRRRIQRSKYYVLLCTPNAMRVPIKALQSPYNGGPAFCGGCPQFFGGTAQGGVMATLQNEVDEESRMTLRLNRLDSQNPFYTEQGMEFYTSTSADLYVQQSLPWEPTGRLWQQYGNPSLMEMEEVVWIPYNGFDAVNLNDDDAILRTLCQLAGCPPQAHYAELRGSATGQAFLAHIRAKCAP